MSNCPQCNGEIKHIPAGISKNSGKPYEAFEACANKCGWKPSRGEKVFEGTKKILVATGHPNLAQNNNDLKKFILNNATALTIKYQEQSASQQMWLNEADIDEYLDRRIKAIAGMMMGLQI